jgi:hypothetical protein
LPEVVIVPPVGKPATVLVIAFDEGVPSLLITDTAMVSPAVWLNTADGTVTDAEPEVTATFGTSATRTPPSVNRTVTRSVALLSDRVRVEAVPT